MLQKHWRTTRIRAGDSVEFWSRPLGGGRGTKQVLGIVALVAVAALALTAPYLVAGAFPFLGAGTLGGALLSAGIGVGGSLLINALVAPRAGAQNQDPAASSSGTDQVLASIQASGNQIKPFSPIPVQYGRLKAYPDFAATPWSEYIGNDQYLNVLLSLGMGKFSPEAIHLDDTLLWDSGTGVKSGFTASVAFYDPGQTVTLFPTNVVSSGSVSGQEILVAPVGFFVVCAPGETVSAIAVDMLFPGGIYQIPLNATDPNQISNTDTVFVIAEYQEINDAGTPIGSVQTLFSADYTKLVSKNPIRKSVKTTVANARYQVRVKRTLAPSTASNVSDHIVWAGLRGFVNGVASFPVSTCAIRIKADRVNANSARKFAVTSTRKINVWNGSAFVEQANRNPLWAFYDAVTNTEYGASRPPSKVDFNTIVTEATAADSRGDCFDYTFASAVTVPDALDTILRTVRARHFWSGDVISVVRDEERTVPDMLLTDREIVRGTLSYDTIINDDQSSDAVRMEYVDEDIWGGADVQYPPNSESFTAENPATIRVDGIVQREKALEYAAFFYLQSIYRRQSVRLDTEWDGRRLTYGAHVRVQSELPQSWGQSGAISSVATNTLTADPAPSWSDVGSKYVRIRTKTGRVFGPVLCTRGADDSQIVLDGTDLTSVQTAQSMTLAQAVAREDGGEPPSFEFGTATRTARDCIVLSGRPSGDNRLSLELAVDNPLIYSTDIGDPPVLPGGNLPAAVVTPQIAGLTASFRQGVAEPILEASWFPADGAQFYRARVSYDGGLTYIQIYEGFAAQLSVVVDRGALELQVAGIGRTHGPWTSVNVDAPVIRVATGTVDAESFYEGLRERFTGGLAADLLRLRQQLDDIALSIADTTDENYDATKRVRSNLVASEGRSAAAITSEQIVRAGADSALAADITSLSATVTTNYSTLNSAITTEAATRASADGAIASDVTTLSATVGGHTTSISTNATAIADISGHLSASYAIVLDGGGHGASLKLLSTGAGSSAKLDAEQIILTGSVKADSIGAREINAGKIAIDGVDILNLIDGSATGSVSATGSNANAAMSIHVPDAAYTFTSTANVTLASVDFDADIGTIDVDAQTAFSYSFYVLTSQKSTWFHYIETLVDGVVKATYAANIIWLDDFPSAGYSKGIVTSPGYRSVKVTGVSTSSSITALVRARTPANYYGSAAGSPGTIVHSQNVVKVFERRN